MRITVLFRNASARCCAPLSPIWLLLSSSVVSVCVKKCRWVYLLSRWRQGEWGLRCCFVMHQLDVVLLYFRYNSRWDLVWWVSVRKSLDRYTYCLDEEREWGLRCCFVKHQPDVVLLYLLSDCLGHLVWWVSLWKRADGYNYVLSRWRERERENEDYGVVS